MEQRIAELEALVKRLEAVVVKQEAMLEGGAAPAGGSGGQTSAVVQRLADKMNPIIEDLRAALPYLKDDQVSDFAEQAIKGVVLQGTLILMYQKFKHSTLGDSDAYVKPLMPALLKVPKSVEWDIHPLKPNSEFKKAIQESFSLMYWPQYKSAGAFQNDEATKSFLSQVAFHGNRVLTGTDEVARTLYEKYEKLVTELHAFLNSEMENILKWTGTEDIEGLEAWLDDMTSGDKLSSF